MTPTSYYNFVVEITDQTHYIDSRADNGGWTYDYTKKEEYRGGSFDYATSVTMDDTWQSLMEAGASCTVRIIRTGNNFCFITTVSGKVDGTAVSYTYMNSVTMSGMDDEVSVYLMCNYCTISGISYTNNTARAYNATYSRVSSTEQSIAVSANSGSDSWAAAASGSYGETFRLVGQISDDGEAAIEWVEDPETTSTRGTTTSLTETTANISTAFCIAEVRGYYVWFDGTNGGMSAYTGATETTGTTSANSEGTVFTATAPAASEVTNTNYIKYTLRGWYDIYNGKYYAPGAEITVTKNTVMYADWKVTSYDIGVADDEGADEDDKHVVDTVSTNSFITTRLFDFNDLFDVYSAELVTDEGIETSRSGQTQTLYTTLSATSHNEVFRSIGTSATALTGLKSLNFLFFRSEAFPYYYDVYDEETEEYKTTYVNLNNYLLDYAANRSGQNMSKNEGTAGILAAYDTEDSGNTLLQMLYSTGNTADDVSDLSSDSFVYGKTYVGTADYLFQYNSTTGYYYYNSALNAASYNQEDERFYVYDYVVAVNSGSSTSDFLPYNYVAYESSYTYGAKKDSDNLSKYKITTNNANYWFGMSTEISFYLAEDVPNGSEDTENYGKVNLSIDSTDENQYHSTFKFSGDDDVWVFIDGQLVLDLGGVHGKIYGEIDFSTGEVTVVNCLEDQSEEYKEEHTDITYITPRGVLDYIEGVDTVSQDASFVQSLEAGAHTLTLYYLERGSGESNSAIYLNISSTTYNLDLSKVDEDGDTQLTGAQFTFYTDGKFEKEAEGLKNKDGEEKSTFSSSETVYGLKEGTLYYVVETTSPVGYTASGKYFTVILKGNVLTITVYDSSDEPQELYVYTINYDSTTGETNVECTVTEDTNAESGVTNLSSWTYVLADANNISVSAVITSGAVSYYNIGFKIANTKEYELPATGSTGIQAYLITGEAIVLFAGMGLIMIAFYRFVWVRKFRTDVNNKENTKDREKRRKRFARTRDHPRNISVSNGHARDRPDGCGASSLRGGMERSRGTGPGSE